MRRYGLLLLLLRSVGPLPAGAQEQPLLLRAARIMTQPGKVVENGMLLIQDGKIQDLGANVETDSAVTEVNLGPGTVVPGLIDAHSSLFVLPGELSVPGAADWDIRDALDPFDDGLKEAWAQGITTVYLSPGNRSPIGGRGAVLKLKKDPSQRLLRPDAALKLSLGVSNGRSSSSLDRLNDYYALRDAFREAQEYIRQFEYYEEDVTLYHRKKKDQADRPPDQREKLSKPRRPRTRPDQEVLRKALQRTLPVRLEAHRPDDLLNAIRLVEEFRLKVVLEGCTEAYRVASEIARRDMPVVLRSTPPPGEPRLEFQHFRADNAAMLAAAGVRLALGTMDSSGRATRFLRLQAAEAVGHGLDRTTAFRAITLTAAEILGLEGRIGSLEEGKDADLVVFHGDPLDARATVVKVMIEGQWVWERGG